MALPERAAAGEAPTARLERLLRTNYPDADLSPVAEAYRFAEEAHRPQKRNSGEPYITHPLAVAEILAEHRLDPVTATAALLHDVLEDCRVDEGALRKRFGAEVTEVVKGVTKIGGLAAKTRQDTVAENLRRLLVAVAKDVRVLLIKLADRLHNMRTLRHLPPAARERIARETIEIYAPLANRMGMATIRAELEDLAFRTLEPEVYADLERRMAATVHDRGPLLEEARAELVGRLAEGAIPAEVTGRTKELYSIHQKMVRKGRRFEEIFDLLALRVLTENVRDCYAALGIVHTLWRPMPRRFKDYIATPKPNMYQALHSTVVGPGNLPIEIQIRTRQMDQTANEGIAAHWRYKSTGEVDERLAWLRQILEVGRETSDPREFMEALKIDLFADQVFVFTPKGDVKELPAGSTVIDFAYAVHTQVGHQTVGAKIDGRIVPLSTHLKSGEVVEVLTQKGARPSRDWLKFVRTPGARSKIRRFFREVEHPEMVERGRETLRREADRLRIEVALDPPSEAVRRAAADLSFKTPDDLFAAIAYGTVSVESALHRLPPHPAARPPEAPRPRARPAAAPVRVDLAGGAADLEVRMAGCCRPVPGDEILGYVSRGRGLTVHRADCPNVEALTAEPGRIVEIAWAGRDAPVEARIDVEAEDRVGLLADLTAAIAEAGGNIVSAEIKTGRPGQAGRRRRVEDGRRLVRDHFVVEVRGADHLEAVLDRLRGVKGVERVRRG